MARATLTSFDELEKILRKMQKPEKMAIKAVDAAAPILEASMKSAIAGATKSGSGLVESIQRTSARQNEFGVFSAVRPVGFDDNGTRYGEILAYLEYGVKDRNQPPRPVRAAAVAAAEGQCLAIIENIINGEVNST